MVSSIDFGADSNRFNKFINRIKNLCNIPRMLLHLVTNVGDVA